MAECEEDDELEINLPKTKTKVDKKKKGKSVENYLHESEDDILDFTEATTNKKILCKTFFCLSNCIKLNTN